MPDNNTLEMSQAIELKKSIYQSLREGDLNKAEEIALRGLEEDYQNPEYEKYLKLIKFWQNRQDLFEYKESSAEKLISEWDKFLKFCIENKVDCKKAFISIKDFIFRNIIDLLIDSYRLSPVPERETLILLGQSFYEIGILDRAIETLEYAMSINTDDEDARIFTLLGNLYSECGENDLAMVMFNDAFLKFPQLVNLDNIDFPYIVKIRQMVCDDGFNEHEVPEWIPVYGYLYEGLTVKRKMEYKDYMELKERVTDYEKTLKVDKKAANIIIPRLINYYLWILDYFLYQVNAFGPAQNVITRILDLIGNFPGDIRIKDKIKGKASVLFKNLMESRISASKIVQSVSKTDLSTDKAVIFTGKENKQV